MTAGGPQSGALSQSRLKRARQHLKSARDLLVNEDFADSVSRSYYAIFQAARALLATAQLESRKHSGVIALFNQHFVKTGKVDKQLGVIYAVKEKPRRQVVDWLLDCFYKTPEGTYRLPADEAEAEAKAEARASGVLRRIKRFLAYLANGSIVPDRERPNAATLADWIRHCKRIGLYEQGKLLYEQGGLNLDHLPEEIAVDVEEDYQVCARMLTRAGGNQPKKKKARTKA